jgi:hypothetical protein
MITRAQFLAMDDLSRQFAIFNALQAGLTVNVAQSVAGSGTAYNLTNAAAAIVLGTTSPVLTITAPGTYLLLPKVMVEAAGATITNQTATFTLRRTNNTAADLPGSPITVDLPVMTTLTNTIGQFSPGALLYSTAHSDDSITIFGSLSAAAGAGNIAVSAANIVAVRLY